ncbi:MAG TPA: sialic acid TRAP transporter substrate-binding protein SiaP [Candidatus Sulfotelmatobacter sp.]|nr:sialic acid TRAP transporter substrate-binding protein SiaP [Candidatus Sulfotelmatobacter sp.]
MKSRLAVALLLGFGLLALAPVASAQTVVKWGVVLAPEHPFTLGMKKTAELVAQRTNNRVQVQIFPSGQLGTGKDMIEAVVFGSQGMVTEGMAMFSQWAPRLSIMEAPYLFRDVNHMIKVVKSPTGREMLDELVVKRGLRPLGVLYYGVRHLTANKPVQKVEDVKGMKIRVPEVPLYLEMIRAWGANPTPMAFSELYLALKQGTVDAQENPIPTIGAGKFYEVQKYLILTGHILVPQIHAISDKLWKSLSPADQKILQEAVDEGIAFSNDLLIKQEQTQAEEFKQKGMQVITPDVAAFKKASMAAIPKLESVWGKGLYEKLQAIQ